MRARFPRLVLPALLAAGWGCSGGGAIPTGPVGPPPEYDFSPLTAAIQAAVDTLPKADRAALLLLQDGHVIYELLAVPSHLSISGSIVPVVLSAVRDIVPAKGG